MGMNHDYAFHVITIPTKRGSDQIGVSYLRQIKAPVFQLWGILSKVSFFFLPPWVEILQLQEVLLEVLLQAQVTNPWRDLGKWGQSRAWGGSMHSRGAGSPKRNPRNVGNVGKQHWEVTTARERCTVKPASSLRHWRSSSGRRCRRKIWATHLHGHQTTNIRFGNPGKSHGEQTKKILQLTVL